MPSPSTSRFGRILSTTLVFPAFLLSGKALAVPDRAADCLPAREFITTLEFLKRQKHVTLPTSEQLKVADRVKQGCRGSAERFVRAVELFSDAKGPSTWILERAVSLAQSSDPQARNYFLVFKSAFASDGLDLTFSEADQMATALSQGAPNRSASGGPTELELGRDFEAFVSRCLASVESGGWELPRAECAKRAVQSLTAPHWGRLRAGAAFDIIEKFIEGSSRDKDGPAFSVREALDLASELLTQSVEAPQEYLTAYRYATQTSGLELARPAARSFAYQLALGKSVQLPQK
jgi:hypothetical protein